MKTLTITEAKKNLGKLLKAAGSGEDIGIISGGFIIALRKVDVEPTDYAWREYGITPGDVEHFAQSVAATHCEEKRTGKLKYLRPEDLSGRHEKASRH